MAASSATAECKDECNEKDDDTLTTTQHTCANDPDFAVICCFMQKFAKDLGLALPNFKHLQEWLTNNDEVAELRDLHIKLLRKTRKTVHEKSWESAISKFCFGYSMQDAWEVERFGYKNSSLKVKLRILRELLESQFERNAKFRAHILTLNAASLRAQPIGRDRLGHAYWLTQDVDCNLRIYQEHLDEEIWQVVATNRDEFVNLIARLRGNEVVLPSKDIGEADEDTTSSSSSSQNAVAATTPATEEDAPEEKLPNLKIKLCTPEQSDQAEVKSKKVKPLLITQAKLHGSPAPAKKRTLDDVDSSPTDLATAEQLKKQRPTLLDTKRMKKPSRYESTKSEDDNEVDSEDSELDEGEEEEEGSLEGEDDSLDSAAADEDENEHRINTEDDDDDQEEEEEVSEAIEEPVLHVRGQGAGRDCDAIFIDSEEAEVEVSDAIEEPVHYVLGLGSGEDCLVGNGNETHAEETTTKPEPKATFFFGEPGCLKLSPIKHAPKPEVKRSIFDSIAEPPAAPPAELEKTNGESLTQEQPEAQPQPEPEEQQQRETEQQPETPPQLEIPQKPETPQELERPQELETPQQPEMPQQPEVPQQHPEIPEQQETPQLNGNESTKEAESEDASVTEKKEDLPKENEISSEQSEDQAEEPVYQVKVVESELEKETATKSVEKETLNNDIEAENVEIVKETVETAEEEKVEQAAEVHEAEVVETIEVKEAEVVAAKNVTETEPQAEEAPEPQQEDVKLATIEEASETPREAENKTNEDIQENVDLPSTSKSIDLQLEPAEPIEKEEEEVETKLAATIEVVAAPTPKSPLAEVETKPEVPIEAEQAAPSPKSTEVEVEANPAVPIEQEEATPSPKSTPTEVEEKLTVPLEVVAAPSPKSIQEAKPIEVVAPLTPKSPQAEVETKPAVPVKIEATPTPKSTLLANRKRRLSELPAPNPRHSTSESEVEAQPLDDEQLSTDEELDVGGKRIKMRPKISNVEARRKVEELKTQIEETTSSSGGEEDVRSRNRKIIAPKRQLEKPQAVTVATKSKPTLAEIIEKKLKKTPEKTIVEHTTEPPETVQTIREVTPPPAVVQAEVAAFVPPKKSPITKPLKKNLLTQLRQEESDEEAVPRKRTNSENVSLPTPPAPESTLQRKRRSSEDAKESTDNSSHDAQTLNPGEKLKRNKEQLPEEKKQAEGKQASPAPAKKESSPTPSVKEEEEEEEEEPAAEVKQETAPAIEAAGRRSGRRGGATVVHTELLQAKRTRGGVKVKPQEAEEKEDEPEKKLPKEEQVKQVKTEAKIETVVAKEEPKSLAAKSERPDPKPESPKAKDDPKQEKAAEPGAKPKQEKAAEPEPKPKQEKAVEPDKPASTPTKTGPGRGRGPRKKREVDTTNIIDTNDSETPVRQSRRIAQQKIKEEAERRKLEEVALRSMKQELKKKKKAEQSDPTVEEPSAESESADSASEAEEETKKKIKKKCPGKDGGWSSDSEEQAESEEEEEEPPHYETDPGSPLFKSDHEFSPESELEDESQVVPMKRARTLRKENAEDEEEYADADESCQKCGKSDHPEWILLCDTPDCNKGYHCSCLNPVLFYIPEGDWHCPPCQQEQLIVALEQQLQVYDGLVLAKQQAKLLAEEAVRQAEAASALVKHDSQLDSDSERDQRKQHNDDDDDDDGVSSQGKQRSKADKSKRRRGDGRSNRRAAKRGTRRRRGGRNEATESGSSSAGGDANSGTKTGDGARTKRNSSSGSGSSSSSSSYSDSDDEPIYKLRKRRQINVSYRLNEYDDLINSALKKEMDEVAGAGNLGRGKDISTIIEADKEKSRREEDDAEEPVAAAEKSAHETDSNDEDSKDEQPLQTSNKFKLKSAPPAKKKPRKLTTLDVSSEEDHGSDEDFKTSSYSDEDTSQSASEESDSSLELYRGRGRGKHQRKAARRAARERRKDRKFVVEESDESEEEQQKQSRNSKSSKSKKKRKEDSDYTETETEDDDDENGSELSENMDSADLCDDTTSDSEDGGWKPNSKRKKKKPSTSIARKSPKLKKPVPKKPKRLEYSDDDISESEPEEDDEDEEQAELGANGAPMSGKGSGKQPRSQPLKKANASPAQSAGKGKGKGKGGGKKKKPAKSSSDEEAAATAADERTRTRGRRYAYIEDFDDDSSDGGIKPGVHRPDTPPEERQKFIQKQEEIKRMLAEKNAEGAKLAATPRLTPIKAGSGQEKRTPGKATAGGDSLSTVPLSVIRQAKVLDIDYLQRKGENIDDLDDVAESELDDAELPDDLPDDMEDAIARMVEEEEQFSAAVAARELPAPDEVLRHTPSKSKGSKQSTPITPEQLVAPASASGLQEPLRKRLPMPTMHPPLLRHQFPGGGLPASLLPPPPPNSQHAPSMHPMLQRHLAPTPPMQLLQNALSAPLGQPLGRVGYPPQQQQLSPVAAMQRMPLGMSMPAAAAHLMQAAAAAAAVRPPAPAPAPPPASAAADTKPRGRRKKVTPLRDQLQKQQTAAATAATAATPPTASSPADKSTPAGKLPPPQPQLFKPHEETPPPPPAIVSQASVITRMPMPSLLPPAHAHQHQRGAPPPSAAAGMYPSGAELARFYGQPLPPSSALRPTYGAPPPLRGAPPATSTAPNARPPPYLHGHAPEHHPAPHLNPYRTPPIYGNPSFAPRVGPPPRPGAVDYAAAPRGYPPYGYYPPPLNTPPAHASAPSSVIVSAPPTATPTNHSVSVLTRGKSPAPSTAPAPNEAHKSSVITSKKLITLEAYSNVKSPMVSADSPAGVAEEDSSSAHGSSSAAVAASSVSGGVGEFSGLVSYFSSQQDDYDT
ncbi:CG8677 [Drosophila busckii]|uniref:CG8677 n=1 Tax=Drosophila busckii TaxID=30019 RepID=A0A0M5J1D1_DROBS|nr:microtubule-associated protein futsch [Drosophila busckii]ALC38781.1 CG8677 [Drosophila busckii]